MSTTSAPVPREISTGWRSTISRPWKRFHDALDAVAATILLGLFASCLWLISSRPPEIWVDVIFDDAYYYLGVARNIILGHGSAFALPFETNGYQPLWLLMLVGTAAVFGTSESGMVLQVVCLSYTCCIAFFVLSRKYFGAGWPAVLVTLAFGSVTLIGLETAALGPLLVLFFVARDWKTRGVLASLIFLTRLDALAIIVGRDLYCFLRDRKFAMSHWLLILPVVLGYFVVNYMYFGVPVPVSGLSKAVGNVAGENLYPGYLVLRSSASALASLLVIGLLYRRLDGSSMHVDAEPHVAACVAIAATAVYYSIFSGWPLWGWYYWPLMFLAFMLIQTFIRLCVDVRVSQSRSILLYACIVGLLYFVVGNKLGPSLQYVNRISRVLGEALSQTPPAESFGRDNVKLVQSFPALGVPENAFLAMGDRAGSLGYFIGSRYRFFHTEGLVGPTAYWRAMIQDRGSAYVAGLSVDYFIADRQNYFESSSVIGIAEPVQGMSSRIGPYVLCFDKSGIVRDEFRSGGARRRVVVKGSSIVDCPGDIKATFGRLRVRYNGLRGFVFPEEANIRIPMMRSIGESK